MLMPRVQKGKKDNNKNMYAIVLCTHNTFSRSPLYSATPVFERWRQMRKRRSIKAFVFAIIKEKGFCLFLLNLSRVITDNVHIRIAIDSSSAFIMRKGEVFIF